jgi:putative ABC transport system permease protein
MSGRLGQIHHAHSRALNTDHFIAPLSIHTRCAVRALDKKLLRDLRRLAGPGIAIAAVVACGIMAFVSLRSAWLSLSSSRDGFYERARLADVQVPLVRAPLTALRELADIDGVSDVEPRIVGQAKLEIEGFDGVIRATVLSLPDDGEPRLNVVRARPGGSLPGRGEVMVSEGFAEAHRLFPGRSLRLTLERAAARDVVISGVGVSPEAVYVLPPGLLWPDDEHAAVVWMRRGELEGALGLVGAANDVLLAVGAGASAEVIADDVHERLRRYGATNGLTRRDMISCRFVEEELGQLDRQTLLIPAIFLGVSAFILHMVLTRLVSTQREIIALLKAIGYSRRTIAAHAVLVAAAIVAVGAVVGVGAGLLLGEAFLVLYRTFFRFDALTLTIDPGLVVVAVALSSSAAVVGALHAAWSAATLPPAQAMQPPTPTAFAHGLADRLGLVALLPTGARMAVRKALRRPLRTLLSATGIAFAIGMIVVTQAMWDAMVHMMDVTFGQSMQEDLSVVLAGERDAAALYEFERIPGVVVVESERTIGVRVQAAAHDGWIWEGALTSRPADGTLRPALDKDGRLVSPPATDGLTLTDELSRRLGVDVGDLVLVDRLDDDRPPRELVVAALSHESLGLQAQASVSTMRALCGGEERITGALLSVEPGSIDAVARTLRSRPAVLSVSSPLQTGRMFRRLMAQSMNATRWVLAALAAVITVGIVYNNARISLAEQARDLATLRVLGFSRREVSEIFLGGELIVLVLALPLGVVIGRGFAAWLVSQVVSSDLFRFRLITQPQTYVFALTFVAAVSLATALLMRRRLDRVDLVAVLKARE